MQTEQSSPAGVPNEPRPIFNPYAPEFDANPRTQYRALREQDPVHWWEASKAWVVSRYADVEALLHDRRFSLRPNDWENFKPLDTSRPATRAFADVLDNGLFSVPYESHVRLRKLIAPAFTARLSEGWRPEVQRIVDEVLDGFSAGDRVDLVTQYADLVPVRVISSILGVPDEHGPAYREYAVAVTQAVRGPWMTPEEFDAVLAPVPRAVTLMRELVEERRAHPKNDLLSTLIQLEEEGYRLNNPELVSLLASLFNAGSDTPMSLITFGVYNILRHPDVHAAVLKDPSLFRTGIEELLRFDLFGRTGAPRYALEDVTLHGRKIRKGQLVLLLISSAMHDPAVFPEPEKLDLRRDTHAVSIAFGGGAHFCMGSHLGKFEGEIAIGSLFKRFPGLKLDGLPVYEKHMTSRKFSSFPVILG